MKHRAQTATEYIIIVAVVIVIALVGATILGVFPGVGSDVGSNIDKQELLTGDIAIENFATTSDGTIMILRNNVPRTIDLQDLSLEGQNCTSSPALPQTVKAGQSVTVTCTNLNDSVITTENPSISILYEDNSNDQQFVVTYGNSEPSFAFLDTDPEPLVSQCNAQTSTGVAAGVFFNGSGSASEPYGICNCTMLQDVDSYVTSNYQMLKTINCNETVNWNGGDGFDPIGGTFTGSFEGNNYKIKNVFMDRNAARVGLFRETNSGAQISNMALINVNISGLDFTGSLVGYSYDSNITNSYTEGLISGGAGVGGLFGALSIDSILSDSHSTAEITGGDNVGGLSGNVVFANVSDSYATGNVNGGVNYVGGLIGAMTSSNLFNSYATGAVTGTSEVGGLVGQGSASEINGSYSTGVVNGTGNGVAGLFGRSFGNVEIVDSYTTSRVYCGTQNCGGLVGRPLTVTLTGTNSWTNYTTDDPVSCFGTTGQIPGTNPAGCTEIPGP